MTGISILPPANAIRPRLLLSPSTLLVAASNLIPVAGVAWWNWDAFLVLMLYWMETAVIAFWTMARILALPPGTTVLDTSAGTRMLSRLAAVVFFTFHSGLFMAVHLLFLWALFSGSWREHIHGFVPFVDRLLIGSGLWLPLLISFVGRGIAFVLENRSKGHLQEASPYSGVGAVVGGLYARIVVMHLTILAGALLAQELGSLAPLVLLIGLKTAFDVVFHIAVDLGPAPAKAS